MVSKLLSYLLKGIFWGSAIFVFNVILWGITDYPLLYLLHENLTFHAIGFLLYGIALGSSTILFESERLNVIQQTIIHASITICAHLIIGFAFEWIPSFSSTYIANAIANLAVIYIVIWVALYFYEKHQINKINAALKKRGMED